MGVMHCQGLPSSENAKGKMEGVSLLQLAADNDVDGLRKAVEGGACIDEPEAWYARKIGKNGMASEQRTAVMIASLYGSVEALSYILSLYELLKKDVNAANGSDGLTPLHCAAGGGSTRVAETVKLLIRHGADVKASDAHGRKPIDVLTVPTQSSHAKLSIQRMLESGNVSETILPSDIEVNLFDNELNGFHDKLKVSLQFMEENESDKFGSEYGKMDGLLSATSTDSFSSFGSSSPLFSPPFPSSPKSPCSHLDRNLCDSQDNSKGLFSDASVLDIKNNIYATDEFRMFTFKVRPCSRAYSHDWTECPFVHPGENARRRDPRRYHYSCVPCPDFRKGACRRGDACEYAHGVFECWLHPAQYRTRLCKDGTNCSRRVCFFAHTAEELRPLFVSTGSAVPSPRCSSAFDSRSTSPPPFSPAQMLMAYSPSSKSLSTPPLSPSSPLRSSLGGPWSPPSVPMLHLPGGSLHSSRLRAARSARDIPLEDLDEISYLDSFMASDSLPHLNQVGPTSTVAVEAEAKGGRAGKYSGHVLNMSPSNLLDLLSCELNSPKAVTNAKFLERAHMSPRSLHYQSQDQLQMQINGMLSSRPSQTCSNFPNHATSLVENKMKHLDVFSSPSPTSPHRMAGVESKAPRSPAAAALYPDSTVGFGNLKSSFPFKERSCLSSKDLLKSASSAAWSDWGSPSGKPDWGVGPSLGKLRKTSSFGVHGEVEPDFSWVQSLVKDTPGDERVGHTCSSGNVTDVTKENMDRIFGAWIEQTHQKVGA